MKIGRQGYYTTNIKILSDGITIQVFHAIAASIRHIFLLVHAGFLVRKMLASQPISILWASDPRRPDLGRIHLSSASLQLQGKVIERYLNSKYFHYWIWGYSPLAKLSIIKRLIGRRQQPPEDLWTCLSSKQASPKTSPEANLIWF